MRCKLKFFALFSFLFSSVAVSGHLVSVKNNISTQEHDSYIRITILNGDTPQHYNLAEGRVLSTYFSAPKISLVISAYLKGQRIENSINCEMMKMKLPEHLKIEVTANPNPMQSDSQVVCSQG